MTSPRATLVAACLCTVLLAGGCTRGRASVPRLSVSLPFGGVDPVGEPENDGTLKLTGWVLSEDPILTVALYIDRRYVSSARLQQPRPDVNRAYPAFGSVNAGWAIEFDTRLFPGDHELVVQARTVHDAVRDLLTAKRHFRD